MKYFKLKKTKYVWLNSDVNSTIQDNGRRFSFEWTIKDLNMSRNAVVSVAGCTWYDTVATGYVIRCHNIPMNDTIDVDNGPAVIHLARAPDSAGIDFTDIKYNIGDSSNWRNIKLSIGTIANKEFGILPTQRFLIGLKFEDFEEEEINPALLPSYTKDSLSYRVPNPNAI